MKIRVGKILFFGTFAIGLVWIVGVTLLFWNMDPKFGGPYRWATFGALSYWLVALLPSTHLALLAIASRFRWRHMEKGAYAYRYLHTAGAPAATIVLISFMLTIPNHSDFELELIGHSFFLKRVQYMFFSFYAVLLALFFPVPGRVWFVAGISLLIVYVSGFALSGWVTETTNIRGRPDWIWPLAKGLNVAFSILFIFVCAQLVINILFWAMFLVFGDTRSAMSSDT